MNTGESVNRETTSLEKLRFAIADYKNKTKLARIANVSKPTIYKILGGATPKLETLTKLCDALNLLPPRAITLIVEHRRMEPPKMFFTDVETEIPDSIVVSEAEAMLILERRNTSNPYYPIRVSILELEAGLAMLPEIDKAARRAVEAALGILRAYAK